MRPSLPLTRSNFDESHSERLGAVHCPKLKPKRCHPVFVKSLAISIGSAEAFEPTDLSRMMLFHQSLSRLPTGSGTVPMVGSYLSTQFFMHISDLPRLSGSFYMTLVLFALQARTISRTSELWRAFWSTMFRAIRGHLVTWGNVTGAAAID
jgi:hypothetical protein